jgi:hypothetical protein
MVKYGLNLFNESSSFRVRKDTKQAGRPKSRSGSCPPRSPFIYKQQVSLTFDGEDDCFRLARIQTLPEFFYTAMISGCGNDDPRD